MTPVFDFRDLGNLINSMLEDEKLNQARAKAKENLDKLKQGASNVKDSLVNQADKVSSIHNKVSQALLMIEQPKSKLILELLIGTKFRFKDEGQEIVSYTNGKFYMDDEEFDINDMSEEDVELLEEYVQEETFQYMYKKNGKMEITDFITESDAKVRLSEYEYRKV